ncbi:geranylgeranyl transferase type-1 subunit beta [Lentinula edodes]|uniref:Geranylgeranyl transferase type-1 subunit beta n=1 Tax=Lentinula edodes TaxID=5353 RepID=A0A1Q3EKZ1_LENED|nr:geranylgeranyl transferase type-1 subunit beta [Lentinula edodes]
MSGTPPATSEHFYLPPLARAAHAGHVKRCLLGLPDSQVDLDSGRMAIAFYCLGSLDLLKMLQDKTSQTDRESWKEWIWEQQTCGNGKTAVFRQYQEVERPTSEHFIVYLVFLVITVQIDFQSYEGGYGQSPYCEANGGTTYIAMAAIRLAPSNSNSLSLSEIRKTIDWAVHKQHRSASCQFKFGGIAKAPGEHPDPYHTYLSLAALSMFPPPQYDNDTNSSTWAFESLDPLINARGETADWARSHIAIQG